MLKNKALLILALIMIINALGFGIIMPLLYPFAKQFGMTPKLIGFMIASFSIAQFLATPIMGAMSDRYGRKPLLVLSLLGTCFSFILFASASSLWMLFLARILDGLTGGNISVAQAVLADITKPEERTRAFGILGATFGFGFLAGPALGGLLSTISLSFPFYFSAALALLGALLTAFVLKETRKPGAETVSTKSFYNLNTPFASLRRPIIGKIISITLLLATAQFCMVVGFQTFSIDVLRLNPKQLGLFFAGFSSVGIIMQVAGIRLVTRLIPSKVQTLILSTAMTAIALFFASGANTFLLFTLFMVMFGLFNSLRDPMLNSLLSESISRDEQGKIMGINQSYMSIGQIIGPVVAGFISTYSVHYIFVASALFVLMGLIVSITLLRAQKPLPV